MSEICCDYCGSNYFSIAFYRSTIRFDVYLFENESGITGNLDEADCLINDLNYVQVVCSDCKSINPELTEKFKVSEFIKSFGKNKNKIDLSEFDSA